MSSAVPLSPWADVFGDEVESWLSAMGFVDYQRDQLAPPGGVNMRRKFGKTGVFCDGLMFGMVTDDVLYVRVDDGNRAAFREAQAFSLRNYKKQGRSVDLSFWRAPERLLAEPDELVVRARMALETAGRIAAKRTPAELQRASRA